MPDSRERFTRTARRLAPHAKRTAGFALVPGLSFLAALFILPAISSRFGANGWIAVGLGQSLGAIAGIVVGLDWPVSGAQAIAQSDEPQRRALYFQSLRYRGVALIAVTIPFAVIIAFLSHPEFRLETVLFFIATSLNGLTASWYFAGTGEPRFLIRNEGLVRLGAYAVSLIGISIFNAPLAFYAWMLCAAGIVMPIASALTISRSPRNVSADWRRSRTLPQKKLSKQIVAAGSRLISQAYYYSGVTIVSLVSPASQATYTSIDQVQKAINNGLSAFPSAFQSWVGKPKTLHDRVRRASLATRVSLAITIPLIALLTFAIPVFQHFLFSGKVSLPFNETFLVAVVISLTLLAQLLQSLGVVPLGAEMRVYPIVATSGVLGLVLLFACVPALGTLGALLALTAAAGFQVVFFLLIQHATMKKIKRGKA